MKTCTKCKQTKPFTDFHKDKTRKDGYFSWCSTCTRLDAKQRYESNPEKFRERTRRFNKKHRDKKKYWDDRWRAANKDKVNERSLRWKKANPLKRKEIVSKYKKANKAKSAALTAKRRARLRHAIPPWLTNEHLKEIEELYQLVKDLEWLCDADTLQVDHIIPLLGKNVCGLHVPWNLRIISGRENLNKSNKLIEELL